MRFGLLGPSPFDHGPVAKVQPVTVPQSAITPAAEAALAASSAWIDSPDELSDGDAAFLDACIKSATYQAWKVTGFEHAERVVEVRFDFHPTRSEPYGGLGPIGAHFSDWINLTVWPVQSVESVELHDREGQVQTVEVEREDLQSRPPRIRLENRGLHFPAQGMAALRITLNTGPGEATEVEPYALAVANAAAYMFDNRGCSPGAALTESGAMSTLKLYRVRWVL